MDLVAVLEQQLGEVRAVLAGDAGDERRLGHRGAQPITNAPFYAPVVIDPSRWRGRRVLVTGHTGFKGAWLALWLQSVGAG